MILHRFTVSSKVTFILCSYWLKLTLLSTLVVTNTPIPFSYFSWPFLQLVHFFTGPFSTPEISRYPEVTQTKRISFADMVDGKSDQSGFAEDRSDKSQYVSNPVISCSPVQRNITPVQKSPEPRAESRAKHSSGNRVLHGIFRNRMEWDFLWLLSVLTICPSSFVCFPTYQHSQSQYWCGLWYWFLKGHISRLMNALIVKLSIPKNSR